MDGSCQVAWPATWLWSWGDCRVDPFIVCCLSHPFLFTSSLAEGVVRHQAWGGKGLLLLS